LEIIRSRAQQLQQAMDYGRLTHDEYRTAWAEREALARILKTRPEVPCSQN
jgi:predicted RNA-binding protein associated with RNAse of E/G family